MSESVQGATSHAKVLWGIGPYDEFNYRRVGGSHLGSVSGLHLLKLFKDRNCSETMTGPPLGFDNVIVRVTD